eukprot:TRINITY_DN21679_c0_g1_i1.p1 TRINITY_DN21679_c0_g1~~TRINITY_DN21679_c0_g1_i1.p1  ORF type:complete len:143 (+),score=33.55 TRINITY_DN21679_c0_g1_i1:45-473(+)
MKLRCFHLLVLLISGLAVATSGNKMPITERPVYSIGWFDQGRYNPEVSKTIIKYPSPYFSQQQFQEEGEGSGEGEEAQQEEEQHNHLEREASWKKAIEEHLPMSALYAFIIKDMINGLLRPVGWIVFGLLIYGDITLFFQYH